MLIGANQPISVGVYQKAREGFRMYSLMRKKKQGAHRELIVFINLCGSKQSCMYIYVYILSYHKLLGKRKMSKKP